MRFLQLLPFSVLLLAPAIACCQTTDNSASYESITHQAMILYNQRDYAAAAALLRNGLDRATRDNKPRWQAVMLGLLGPVLEQAGKYPEAEDALYRSINDWTMIAGPDTFTLVAPLQNLGELYSRASQPSRAEKLLTRALSIEGRSGRDPDLETRLLTNLGNAYFEEHRDDLAEQTANAALENISRMKQPSADSTAVYSLLGAVCFRSGRLAEAESWLRRSLSLRESLLPSDDPRIADSLANLAALYSHSDQPEKARPMFERASRIFETAGGDDRFIRNFYSNYADFERKTGHKKEARQLSRRVDKLWTTSSATALSTRIVDVSAFRNAK